MEVPQTKELINIPTDIVLQQSPIVEGLEQHLEQLEEDMVIATHILQIDNQSGVEDAGITLNNSFDLLSSVEVIPHGEDTLADETFNVTSEG